MDKIDLGGNVEIWSPARHSVYASVYKSAHNSVCFFVKESVPLSIKIHAWNSIWHACLFPLRY